jgi:hypothetical protein
MLQNFKNIVLVFSAALLSFATFRFDPELKRPHGLPTELNTVIVTDSFLYADSLELPLYKIPKVSQIHTVAKLELGKWAKLFTVLKIEESGSDGQTSVYALKYYNLVGMRYPQKRKTTAIRRGYSYYSVYENWYESIVDFQYYMDYMEGSFYRKFKRYPKNEKEFVRHIHGSYNVYDKWLRDVFWLLDNFHYR